MNHGAFDGEVSEIYYNDYSPGKEEEFEDYLNKLLSQFTEELNTDLEEVRHPKTMLVNLRNRCEQLNGQFQLIRTEQQNKVLTNKNPVPQDKIDFFNTMTDLQESYIDQAQTHVEEIIAELETEKGEVSNSIDLKLQFNLKKKEVATLFLLLESAGFIKNVNSSDVLKFIEKHVMFEQGGVYKPITALSTQLSQIRNDGVLKPHTVERLKQKLSEASIETNN